MGPYRRLGHVGGWMPRNKKTVQAWLVKMVKEAKSQPRPYDYAPVIQEFKELIETDSIIYMLFNQMFDQIPAEYCEEDPTGAKQILNYNEMLCVFNYILKTAPKFNTSGLVGFPMNAVLDWPMGTPAGYAAFLNYKVNSQFRKMLDVWKEFLEGPASTTTLTADDDGWFGYPAMQELEGFVETYKCNPRAPHYGFTSWDEFFVREFREGVRPLEYPTNDNIINNACESKPLYVRKGVKERDQFWIKDQPYSLVDIFAHAKDAETFTGGTIYQAFLSALSYHRWHSPVKGKIVKIKHIPGTYYSQCWDYGFTNPEGPDPAAPDESQAYITAVATRVIVFIESDNPKIGLMAFVAVGMAEVSSCEVTVQVGDAVDKGDEIGMFHFGGSTHCLIFRPGVNVLWSEEVKNALPDKQPDDSEIHASSSGNIMLRKAIAVVV